MKSKFIIPSLVLAVGSLFISCEADVSVGDDAVTTEISSSNLSGFLDSQTFTPATTHFEQSDLFGDEGYKIKFFQEVEECDEFQSYEDISFFVVSDSELTPGNYEGKGPYFHYSDGEDSGSASFFGASVIIEEVTATQITGRVKGGDDNNEHYIEGKFVAQLCQK